MQLRNILLNGSPINGYILGFHHPQTERLGPDIFHFRVSRSILQDRAMGLMANTEDSATIGYWSLDHISLQQSM